MRAAFLLLLAGPARADEGAAREPDEPIDVFDDEEEDDEDFGRRSRESGVRLGVALVGGKAFGTLGDSVAPGLGGDLWFGYEALVGDMGLVPRLAIQYVRFLGGEAAQANVPTDFSGSVATVFPGMALTVRAPARPWVGFGFGYGRLRVDDQGGGLAGSALDTGFGIALQGGIEFLVTDVALLGVIGDYTVVFMQEENRRWVTFGLGATFRL